MGESITYSFLDLNTLYLGGVFEKIYSFRDLEEGWDYGQGFPSSLKTVENALEIATIGQVKGFGVDAFPSINGAITVSLFTDDNFIYITVYDNGGYDLRYEKGIGENYELLQDFEAISLDEVIQHINTLYSQCFSLEPYTSKDMIQTPNDLPVIASRIMVGESQYSRKNAQFTKAGTLVDTLQPFTIQQWETQYSTVE